MKKLSFILLFLVVACSAQQQLEQKTPLDYIGTWINTSRNDIIIIKEDKITFTTVAGDTLVDFIDFPTSSTILYYSYQSNHGNLITFKKVSKRKIIFNIIDENGLLLRNDFYVKK